MFLFILLLMAPNLSANSWCEYPLKEASWAEKSEFLKDVPATRVGGALVVDGEQSLSALAVVTEDIAKQFGNASLKYQEVPARTYSYYPQRSVSPDTSKPSRGGGRDLLIKGPISAKGAGPNAHFSRVNGSYDIQNFRTNGLLPVIDSNPAFGGGFTEYIVGKNLKAMGIPVIDHYGMLLLPSSKLDFPKWFAPAQRPIELIRDLSPLRESMADRIPTVADRIHTTAMMEFWNLDHGALNPENMTIHAEVVDLGHVGPGYPVTSGTHRCTICAGGAGSNADESHLGALDYYFPASMPAEEQPRAALSLDEYRKLSRRSKHS